MPSPLPATLDDLKAATADTIVDSLNGLIDAANADLQTFANAIVADTLEAAAAGRPDLLAALADQVKVLAEANRVRFVSGLAGVAERVIITAVGLAVRIAVPPIPRIPNIHL